MDSGVTAIGSYTVLLAKALEARGIPSRQVFERAGVEVPVEQDPLHRVDVAGVRRIFEIVFETTGDPSFGLEVGRHFRLPMLHALGYSLLASRTLRDFCTRLSRSFRLVSQGANFEFVDDHGETRASLTHIAAIVPPESEDVASAVVVASMREVMDGGLALRRVELRRKAPALHAHRYEDYFCCPVEFGKPNISIVFDSALLDVPLTLGSEELAQVNDRIVRNYLNKFDRADFENRARSLVVEALPSGGTSKVAVARRLGVSARTLQARLGERGTSFVELTNSARRTLASAYLDDPSISIAEIAYLVGFSDASNFCRAFKRWTGVSPSSYRENSARAANWESARAQ
jgi:AraC-like DNA-binding protein